MAGVNNIQLIYIAHLNQWDNSTHPAGFLLEQYTHISNA